MPLQFYDAVRIAPVLKRVPRKWDMIEFSGFTFATGLNASGQTITNVSFTTEVANTTQQGSLSMSDFSSVWLTGFSYNTDPNAINASANSLVYNSLVQANFPGSL